MSGNPDGIWAIFIRIRGCLTEKKRSGMLLKEQRKAVWIFMLPTEHNLMHTGWCKTSLCVLPGIEVTTDKGHMNLFGITEMPEKILEIVKHNGEEIIDTYMDQTIAQAKQKGWIRSINHPFLTIWKWQFENTDLRDINCMEIINDPTYPDGPGSK